MKKRKRKVSRVLTRLRRQKIDPTQYGATHMTEEMLQADVIMVQPTSKPTFGATLPPVVSTGDENAITSEILASELLSTSSEPQDQLQIEKNRELEILARLFGDKDEWDGKESDFGDEPSEIEEGDGAEQLATNVELSASRTTSETEQAASSLVHRPESSASTSTRLKDLFVGQPLPGTHLELLITIYLSLTRNDLDSCGIGARTGGRPSL